MGIFDNIWRNSLTFTVVACSVLVTVSYAAPFSKYGRKCQDIGCLPSEVCVMTQDACSFGQRDGKDCGSYPTCKKQGGAGTTTNNNRGQGVYTLNPAPDNTRFSMPGVDNGGRPPSQYHPATVDPNLVFGQPPAWSGYPHFQAPMTPPPGIMNYPQYPPNPNSGYIGQFPPPPYYGGSKSSGTANQPNAYNPITSRPTMRPTTQRPSAPAFPSYDNRDRIPQTYPSYPSYPGTTDNRGGGGSFGGGGGFGGGGHGGGGSNIGGYVPPGYDPDRDRPSIRPGTTKKPGGGFFDSLQDRLGQEIGNYVKNAIFNQIVGGGGNAQGGGTSTRFGSGGSGGSGGGSPFSSIFGGGSSGGSGGSSSGFGSLFGGGGSSNSGSSGLSSLFGLGGGGESSSQRRGGFGLFSENPSANTAQNRQQVYSSQTPIHHASDTTQKTTPKYGWNV